MKLQEFKRPVVYGHFESGHTYKVLLLLALADTSYSYREIDIFADPSKRPRAFTELSRFNEVPVLQDEAVVLSQSNVILQYLAQRLHAFGGETAAERFAIQEWLFWEMSRLNLGVANLRFFRGFLPDTPKPLVDHFVERSEQALDRLDREVGRRDFLVGGRATIADISCCGYLFWANEAELDLVKRWPAVADWLVRIAALPGWRPPRALLGNGTVGALGEGVEL